MKKQTIRSFGKFITVVQLVFFLTNCGAEFDGLASSQNSDSDSPSSQTIMSPVVGGQISQLTLTGSTPVTIPTNDQDGAVLMVVSQSSNQEFHDIEIQSAAANPETATSTVNAGFLTQATTDSDHDATTEFHLALRDAETELDANDAPPAPGRYATKALTTGETRTFKVIHDFSNTSDYGTVEAKLIHESELFDVYIDERDESKINGDDLKNAIAEFERVLPVELSTFGHPSDINQDGKFAVLFTQEINAMAIRYGGLVTGFFYAIDLMDDKKYPSSNEMEVFYVMVPDPEAKFSPTVPVELAWDIISGVLVHELQHMINFNMRFFERGLPPEEGWLNEGLSHLIEDIYSMDANGYFGATGAENPSRVARYLDNIANICITCGTTLEERGGTYLFLRYLYEQAEQGALYNVENGMDLLNRFLDSNERGIKNLKASAFGSVDSDEDLAEFLAQFGLAAYFAGSNIQQDPRLEVLGMDLRGLQSDSRGTYLSGPSVIAPTTLPLHHVVSGHSVSYIQISPQLLYETQGSFKINMANPEDFQIFVIK